MTIPRKRRSESFFGIHFDFHARRGSHPIGTHQRPDIFAEMLDTVKPDYLQCDTKGHQGLSSYPTKCGYAAPGITVDNLRMLRELTAERGIALYAHYSGIYDITCAEEHPDWAVVDAEGQVSKDTMSVFGPYVDEILIPQLKEIAVDYGLDGAWVDGDCWWTKLDYSVHARRAWRERTGREDCPRAGDADFEAYREFCRQGFRDYIRHYCEAVKAVAPHFQLASNWMYTDRVPEKVDLPLDFISGDYAAQNSYYSARFHARCMMHQGIPWDLMAWGQNAIFMSWLTDDRTTKEYGQYCQEASVVLALGGGFQFFNHQYDGGCLVQKWAIPLWGRVADFCRERQPFCFGGKEIPQVGILMSRAGIYAASSGLFNDGNAVSQRVGGLIDLCADSQITCGVIMTHRLLEESLDGYGLVLVPDSDVLEPEVVDRLRQYAEAGGALLLCGPDASRHFGIPMAETGEALTYVAHDGRMASFTGNRADFIDPDPSEVASEYHGYNYFESPARPMSLRRRLGRGTLEALCFDLGMMYTRNRTTLIRDYLASRVDALFPGRALRVEGSVYADVSLMRKDGKIMVHLINSAGPHSDLNVRGFTEIPKIGPLTIRLRLDAPPCSVELQPEGTAIPFEYTDGILTAIVPTLEIYSIVVVST